MTLPGPSRTIIVEPIELPDQQPAPVEPDREAEPEPQREPAPPKPEREPEKVPG